MHHQLGGSTEDDMNKMSVIGHFSKINPSRRGFILGTKSEIDFSSLNIQKNRRLVQNLHTTNLREKKHQKKTVWG
jgi:hypothetical protein